MPGVGAPAAGGRTVPVAGQAAPASLGFAVPPRRGRDVRRWRHATCPGRALDAPLLSEPEPCGVLPCWLALLVALAHPFLLMHKKRVPKYTFITYEERVLCTLQR